MVSRFVQYHRSEIHYIQFGKGNYPIVCLHGYGESGESFICLAEHLPEEYSIIALDLPFHGITRWHEERAFLVADMVIILNEILRANGNPQASFMIMGFSMGGRVAMSLAEQIPERISRVILLAPDGMKVNFWYWLATQTKPGNRLFRFTAKNPTWLLQSLRISNRFKLVNKSIFKFLITYFNDEKIRNELFHRWTCMRTFKPDLLKLKYAIQQKQLPVRLLYGVHDRIILSKKAVIFRKGLEEFCHVDIIDAGHRLLQKKYALVITRLVTS